MHFKEGVKRLKENPSTLKAVKKGSEDLALMKALTDYISLTTSYDPFNSLKGKIEGAGKAVKELLYSPLASYIKKLDAERAQDVIRAAEEDFKVDFEAMVTYVCAASSIDEEKRSEVEVLRDFYSEYVLEREFEFLNAFSSRDKEFEKGKETGFKALDGVLEGGLYSGLYVIGAPSSAGKTSFCVQLADQLAENGHKVLFFSLEMSKEELVSKSLSRYSYRYDPSPLKKNAKSERKLTSGAYRSGFSGEEWDTLAAAAGKYAVSVSPNMTVKESVGEYGIREIESDVNDYIAATGKKPVVFIDYLQILKPIADNMTDKQNMDRTVSSLKRLCRDKGLTVFVISSFNRASYNTQAGLESFKESGAIEYSADVVFSLQPSGMSVAADGDKRALTENKRIALSVKKQNQRELVLSVLKNRRGRCGIEIEYVYNCVFSLFSERGIKEENPYEGRII